MTAAAELPDKLQSPTVESQARLIDGHDQPAGDTPLVAIHPGESGPPLVLVHAAGGNVLCYADLASHVNMLLYALAARGVDTSAPPLEDLAAAEPGKRMAAILERAQAAGAVGAEADLVTLRRVAEVARANVRAAMAYRPVPDYPGPITVLSAGLLAAEIRSSFRAS